MSYLLFLGLLIFFGIHCLPYLSYKRKIIDAIGENNYKSHFSVIAGIGLSLIVFGYARSEFIPVYFFPFNAYAITAIFSFLGFYFIISKFFGSSILNYVSNPMSWGVVLWSIGHLISNGDLAAIFLFGSFLIFSIIDTFLSKAKKDKGHYPIVHNLVSILLASILFYAIYSFHGILFGIDLN